MTGPKARLPDPVGASIHADGALNRISLDVVDLRPMMFLVPDGPPFSRTLLIRRRAGSIYSCRGTRAIQNSTLSRREGEIVRQRQWIRGDEPGVLSQAEKAIITAAASSELRTHIRAQRLSPGFRRYAFAAPEPRRVE